MWNIHIKIKERKKMTKNFLASLLHTIPREIFAKSTFFLRVCAMTCSWTVLAQQSPRHGDWSDCLCTLVCFSRLEQPINGSPTPQPQARKRGTVPVPAMATHICGQYHRQPSAPPTLVWFMQKCEVPTLFFKNNEKNIEK